jgi:hypothetical protein
MASLLTWLRRSGYRSIRNGILVLLALFLLGSIPEGSQKIPTLPHSKPFLWNEDNRWFELEHTFLSMREIGAVPLQPHVDSLLRFGASLLNEIERDTLMPTSLIFDTLEETIFTLCPMTGVCTNFLPEYTHLVMRTRDLVKEQSERWDLDAIPVRDRMYRLMFGSRAALEEVILQAPPSEVQPISMGVDEPSETPSAFEYGVVLHSGDMLLSRSESPISAIIARGNDYPGVFSHIGIVYVDPQTKAVSVVEALPFHGVVVTPIDEFFKRINLRVMLLRLRHDHPILRSDPMIPHKAANAIRKEALARHISYDIEVDEKDHSRMYCSEVVSSAYEQFGLRLWMGISKVSSPGLAAWLGKVGITHLEFEQPSDLEYDPQVRVVAEWRDPAALYMDHIENAAVEVIIDGADHHEALSYPWYMLPIARVAKLYCIALEQFDGAGPIPEGMSPAQALCTQKLEFMEASIANRVKELADAFKKRERYSPPDPELVLMARQAKTMLY